MLNEIEFILALPSEWKGIRIARLSHQYRVIDDNTQAVVSECLLKNEDDEQLISLIPASKGFGYECTHTEGNEGGFPIRPVEEVKEQLHAHKVFVFYQYPSGCLKMKNLKGETLVFYLSASSAGKAMIHHENWVAPMKLSVYYEQLKGQRARIADENSIEYQALAFYIALFEDYFDHLVFW